MTVASRPLLRRLQEIHSRIRSGRYPNATTLARELDVSVRTVQRDLDVLRDEQGAPIAYSASRRGLYYRQAGYQLPGVELQEADLLALFLAERVLQTYQGAEFAEAVASAFGKLLVGLSASVTVRLEHLAEACSVRVPGVSRREARTFARLVRAADEGRQLSIRYWTASRDEERTRVIDPYHLMSVKGDWYLFAYCHWRKGVRTFVPARVLSLRETGKTFERPADFDPEHYLDGSFRVMRGDGEHRVRLRFSPTAARYVREKQWHATQKLREVKGGGVELTMTVTHLFEVKQWVLSYGSECEVLEPEELRREVAEELRRTLARYDGTESR